MKKFYVTIVGNDGVEKTVSVLIPEETAVLLEQCDEEVRNIYLTEEYKTSLIERAETRRHMSLDVSMDNGHDFEADIPSGDETLISKEELSALYQALSCLTSKQRKIVYLHVIKKKSFRKIGVLLNCILSSGK